MFWVIDALYLKGIYFVFIHTYVILTILKYLGFKPIKYSKSSRPKLSI